MDRSSTSTTAPIRDEDAVRQGLGPARHCRAGRWHAAPACRPPHTERALGGARDGRQRGARPEDAQPGADDRGGRPRHRHRPRAARERRSLERADRDAVSRRVRARRRATAGSGDEAQGIEHVVAPELGYTLPGTLLVCGDSHTCTNGALGALAWGIGSSEVCHVLATQSIVQQKPKTMRVTFEGELAPGVSAKDMILALIGKYGTAGGRGYGVEYAGPAVRALGIEARMTLCNLSIEFGAKVGMVAPDDKTFEYVKGRRYAP